MRVRHKGALIVSTISLIALFPQPQPSRLFAQDTAIGPAASQPDEHAEAIDELLDALGDAAYLRREEATRALFALGPEIMPRLRNRLGRETDPEIQHRLRYLLENLVPPPEAVLLVGAAAQTGLEPGTVITHVNSRRVRRQSELRQQLAGAPRGFWLRVRGPSGPREVGPVDISQLALSDYVAPRGEVLARSVRLYATGFAEQAWHVLRELPEPIPENELSKPLRARIAYTAGDGEAALELMAGQAGSVRPTGADWSSPSYFDLCGPGRAPFHLEWTVATRAGPDLYATTNDPDLRVQRILLPAHRFADALERTAGYWWRLRRELGSSEGADHLAGNQLAVAAWMLHEMDLRSECCRLIEPRSTILRRSPRQTRKWVRVETDAWLALLAGEARAALDGFYDDALDILQHPPRPDDQGLLIRNPHVAARVAFFLYQFPDDERVEKGLRSVSHHAHPALTDYLDWMLDALHERNHAAIRRDLHATLPRLSDETVLPYARAVALLEYVQSRPDPDVLHTARQRLSQAPPSAERGLWLAIVDAALHLLEGRPSVAGRTLLPFRQRAETAALWHTAGFLSDPPASAANHAALRQPVLAVPMGTAREHWLILSRDRRLMHFDAAASLLTALEKPTPTWFPNPLTWPWIGREDSTGRVWVYARRRAVEVVTGAGADGLRLNLRTDQITAFDGCIGPHFSRLADAIATVGQRAGEDSEFLRAEIRAHAEYCADPDLPEIGMIEPLRQAPRVVHAALRGGPHLLIDTATQRSWTSRWIEDRLGLKAPLTFFAQALWGPGPDGAPVVMLMSNQGLIRFEVGTEHLSRIPLPGADPFPSIIPESTPYDRRDPRYVYCARLPEDGGQAFRVTLADGSTEQVDMINEALPAHYYNVRSRSEIRAAVNRSFGEAQLPDLQTFISDATETVARWAAQRETKP